MSWFADLSFKNSTFGRIIPGHMGDKFGVFNIMIIFTAFGGIISLALWLPSSANAPTIVFAVLYGIASGNYRACCLPWIW